MSTLTASKTRIDAWILGALAAGLALRLLRLDEAALWLDETDTARWVRMPWADMLRAVLADNHPPLYFIVVKAWTDLAGSSPFALRLPSALMSWGLIPLTAAIAWTLVGRNAARWAAWIAALSPYLLQHAQDARMYALLALLAAANLLLIARFLRGTSPRLGWGFWLVNAAMLATHYYALIFIAAQGLALLALAPRRWRDWIPAMAASCALVIAPLLAIKFLVGHTNVGANYEVGLLALPGMVWAMIGGYTLLPSPEQLHESGVRAAAPYIPVVALGLAALLPLAWAALRALPRAALLLLAGVAAVMLLGAAAMGVVFGVPLNPRYAIAAWPALAVLIAAGMPSRWQARSAAAALLLGIMVAGSVLHLKDPGARREDVRAAGRWLDANVPVDEPILVTSNEMASLARFHWPQRTFVVYPRRGLKVTRANAVPIAQAAPVAPERRTIYLYGREWESDPTGALRAELQGRYGRCEGAEVRGISILCLDPAAGAPRPTAHR